MGDPDDDNPGSLNAIDDAVVANAQPEVARGDPDEEPDSMTRGGMRIRGVLENC